MTATTELKENSLPQNGLLFEPVFIDPLIHIKDQVPHAQINYLPELEVLLKHLTIFMENNVFRTSSPGNHFKIMVNKYLQIIFTHFKVMESRENNRLTLLVATL